MNYPSIKEYKEAILFAEDNFEQLKNLRPVLEDDGSPVMTSGNFAVVFKMKDEQTGKLHAVKCFLREQEGRAEAYRQIAEELEYVSSTFLTPIKYLDKELFVDTNAGDETEFPVLLMDWVEGLTLDKYIREHIDDQYELSLLAYQFSRLAMWLMPQPFAHGDLKPDNILVKEDGTLVLVDYDGMYVPAMKGQKARELGSPDFRHPSRTETDFDEHIDDFSLASILLSLKAISLQPSLLKEYGAQDRLLFSEKDYRYLSESEVLNTLRLLMQDTELASLYSLLILAISQKNLSQVSFRLFNLNRPKEPEMTEEDYEAWIREIEADYEQSQYEKQYQDWIEKCFNESNKENLWPLLTFARLHGKMQVGEFANKETGEAFKSCIFTKPDGSRIFVAFSATMGELTPKEIAAMKDELVVVQYENGNYCLCKREQQEENLPTTVTDEDLNNAWTDNYGAKYSRDWSTLLKGPDIEVVKSMVLNPNNCRKDGFWLSKPILSKKTGKTVYWCSNDSFQDGILLYLSSSIWQNLDDVNKESVWNLITNGYYMIREVYDRETDKWLMDNNNQPVMMITKMTEKAHGDWNDDITTYFEELNETSIYTIKDGTIIISDYAFSNCKSLKQVILPDSIQSIGRNVFKGCDSLQTILIPSGSKAKFERLLPQYKDLILPQYKESIDDLPF